MTRSQTWGLVHSSSLTVPFMVTVFSWSNMENEWCAKAGAEMAIPTSAEAPASFRFMAVSCDDQEAQEQASRQYRLMRRKRQAAGLFVRCEGRPILDFDASGEHRLTAAAGPEHQRFAIRHIRDIGAKRRRDVRRMRHDQPVGPCGRRLGHHISQPS